MNTPLAAPLKHSGLGISATIIAVLAGLALVAVFVYAGMLGMGEGGQLSETDPRVMTIGLVAIAAMGLTLLGAILGIAGLFVGERKRVFAWVGLVLNTLPLLAAIALVVVGMSMAP